MLTSRPPSPRQDGTIRLCLPTGYSCRSRRSAANLLRSLQDPSSYNHRYCNQRHFRELMGPYHHHTFCADGAHSAKTTENRSWEQQSTKTLMNVDDPSHPIPSHVSGPRARKGKIWTRRSRPLSSSTPLNHHIGSNAGLAGWYHYKVYHYHYYLVPPPPPPTGTSL